MQCMISWKNIKMTGTINLDNVQMNLLYIVPLRSFVIIIELGYMCTDTILSLLIIIAL